MIDNAADLTLDELRLALAPAVADSAIFDGWTETALLAAAELLPLLLLRRRRRWRASIRRLPGSRLKVAPWRW